MERETEFFITRHTEKNKKEEPSPEGYPGISEAGVELAKERAQEIIELIESASEGTIMPLVGVSPVERTRSTMKVYSKTLKENLAEKKDIIFISRQEIKNLYKEEKGVRKTIEAIKKKLELHPNVKVVIEFPLMLPALSDDRWWNLEDQDKPQEKRRPGPYIDHLGGLKRFREQRAESIKQWFEEKGIVNHEQIGPNPSEIAERHLKSFGKLEKFLRKIFPREPLKTVVVGHSLEMDAFFTYLANQGEISSEGFEKIGGEEMQETEPSQLILKPDGNIELNYRGKHFEYNPKIKHEKKAEE